MGERDTEQYHKERTFPYDTVIHHKGRFIDWSIRDQKPLIYNVKASDFFKELHSRRGPYSGSNVSAYMKLAQEYGSSLGPSITPEEIAIILGKMMKN